MLCWWRAALFSTLKMLLLLCFLWSIVHVPVVLAAPALPGHGSPALDAHLITTVPMWYVAVLAVLCIVCPVILLTMCICCKKSAFKPSPLTESTLQIPEVTSISSHVSRDMQLQGMSSGNQSPSQEQIHFESLPDLSHVWKPSHFPSTAAVRFPQTFEEESSEDTAAAVHWFGSPHQNFPRSQLQYVRQIGTGRYGLVLEGRALGVFSDHTSTPESCASSPRTPPASPSQVVSVVVKTLREEADQQQQAAFLQEMAPYRVLDHRNVLRVLAVCLESPPLLVLLQHCNKGTLKRYLQQEGANLSQRQLLTIVTDVAAGLAHMHEHNFCHTDLAARNCLVDSDGTVKVGDYGCSLDRYKHEYYLAGDIALPLRWCPPESLTCTPTVIHTSRVNSWGNVWSYGVVCHEVFTKAAHLPYHPLNDEQVLQRVVVEQSLTPDLPPSLHIQVRALIQQCWVPESSRISMTAVHSGLCQTLLQLYGVQHSSCDPDSLPSSLHLPASPRSAQDDIEAKWHKLEQEQRAAKDHNVPLVASPRDHLRFENDFVSREADDLEARVAATFGSSAPSWLGLDPDQPMDSLTREISSAIQRLDDALAQPPHSELQDQDAKNFKDDDLLPAFVIGKDSLVTRAPRSVANMSASTSNLTSIGAECAATAALELPPSENINKFAHLSSSAGFMTQMGLEEDGLSMRLEKGEFTELVKQKSMSVQNLMRLTVVDGINLDDDSGESDSSCKFSMGDKNAYLFQASDENSAKKAAAKLPLDFCGSTSSILSSALSTTSSGATRSSVRDPFLVAANSSELLLQEELSEQEFPLSENASNPNLTVSNVADFSNAGSGNNSRLYSTDSSVQRDSRTESRDVQSSGVSHDGKLIGIDSENSSCLDDSTFHSSGGDLIKKLEFESPCSDKSPKSNPCSDIVISQDVPVLSTPDVTMEACHSLGCASAVPFYSSSKGEDQHHRGSFDSGQDPLPDIVVHDHSTHAKRHLDETNEYLLENESIPNLSSKNLPLDFHEPDGQNNSSKDSHDREALNNTDSSDQLENSVKTSVERKLDCNSSDHQSLNEGRQDSPKFNPELNSTFSIFASKDGFGGSRDSETSGIVTGGYTAFTEDMTNCSGMSASEMLSSDSVFLDGTFDVVGDNEENLPDSDTGNEISQDPGLSDTTVTVPEGSMDIKRPSLTEPASLNHESISIVESPELVTNFIVDPLQEVRVSLPDRNLLAARPHPVNPLDWSVDSLPPNSILDPHAGRHHFKPLLTEAKKDVRPEDREVLSEGASLEPTTVNVKEKAVGQIVDGFGSKDSEVQNENLNSAESTDVTKITSNTEERINCIEASCKDQTKASPSKGEMNNAEGHEGELLLAAENGTATTSDVTSVVLATNSVGNVVISENSSLLPSVKRNEINNSCGSDMSAKDCNDSCTFEMEPYNDVDVEQKTDEKVALGLHNFTEELHGNLSMSKAGGHLNVQKISKNEVSLQESLEEISPTVSALINETNESSDSAKVTLTSRVGSSVTSCTAGSSVASPVLTLNAQDGKNGSSSTEDGQVGEGDPVFNESDALTASTTSVNSDIAVIDTPEAENNEGEFWQQQMSAWKTAAQETRMLLLEASTASPLAGHQNEPKKNLSYLSDDFEFSPCLTKDVDTDSLSVTSSSAYSANDRETDCSFESSPCRKKYPVTPAHFVVLPRSGESSSDSSPVCSTVRPLITPVSSEAKKVMGAFPSPIKRPSYLSSPTSSCGSESPGAHSSYVSYADDAIQDPLTEGDDLLGYCSEDLNALRAELSLKLPASPREKDALSLSNDNEDGNHSHDEDRSPDYTYCGSVSDDIEVVDNNRDHVIINYRPPTTLSPIKEEPCSSVGWDSCNFEENSASTYNSSIELVDCYEDSPSTSALDVVSVENSAFNSAFSLDKISRTTLLNKLEDENEKVQQETPSENVDEVTSVTTESVSQHPIASSSVIFTANNEVIPVDRDSLILEDLETEEDRPSVLVFTPRDDPDKPKTLDSDDLLVVDVDTNEASIVETPKPRSLLAFVHSPPLSPHVLSRLSRNDEESPVTENEALERLHEDYQDDVDQDSLPYEVNSSSDKLLYLKFKENLTEHNALNRKTREAKDFRESGPRSIDCAFLSDPLCDMDFDSAWQQRSLDNFKLGEYYFTPSALNSTEQSRDDILRSDVNGCLTTNSPNTASETSQSSGLMFRLGTEDKETTGEHVSRYQPYFNTSLNSLSQLDSSLLYGEDHVSLPYTVNLRSPDDEQNDYVLKPNASFSSFKSLDSAVNSKNRMKDFVSSKAHSEDTFIRSEEIDLKDQMVRELGQQIECIKSYRKEKRAVSGDEDSSDEELTSFSLGLLTQAYNEGTNGLRHESPEGLAHLSDDGSESRRSFASEAPVPADEGVRNSCTNYDSDDFSAETDYTGSNERRIYDSLRCVTKSDDLIPRPMNPEPAELSDLPCTPSPSISIDCSLAPAGNTSEEQKLHSNDSNVLTPVESIVVNGYEGENDTDKKSDLDSTKKNAATYRTFHASSLLKLEETESDDAVEDLSIGESKSNVPSPVVTPGMLSSIRYRIDSNLTVESPLARKHTDVDGNDCIPSKFTHTDADNENDVGNSNDNNSSETASFRTNVNETITSENKQKSSDDEVGRDELYTPDFEEDDDDEKGMEASPGPSKRTTNNEVDSEDENEEEDPIESDDSDVSENNSSSSGEFLWQPGDAPAQARPALAAVEEEDTSDGDSESGEEEFTPSFWDASRTPTRSLLKSGCEGLPHDRSVHWKRQRHHRVYEYPPEPPLPTFPPPPAHRPLWDPPITPFSPPHHQWGVDHQHGETFPALQAYMQRGFLQQDGFLLDDGEFYNPELHYNFSQSSFTPAEFYPTESQHGNPNTPNFDSPEPSNIIGGVAPSFMAAGGGDTDPQLPPTHEQLQNMLLYQFAPALPPVKTPNLRQTSGDPSSTSHSTEDNTLVNKVSNENVSPVSQNIRSCSSDASRSESYELSSVGDSSSSVIDEKNPNSVGELRHLKEQLKLDIPKLRNEDDNCTAGPESQSARDKNSSNSDVEKPNQLIGESKNSCGAELMKSNSVALDEVSATPQTELTSDIIENPNTGKLSCLPVENGAVESKVGNILLQTTTSTSSATSPLMAIK